MIGSITTRPASNAKGARSWPNCPISRSASSIAPADVDRTDNPVSSLPPRVQWRHPLLRQEWPRVSDRQRHAKPVSAQVHAERSPAGHSMPRKYRKRILVSRPMPHGFRPHVGPAAHRSRRCPFCQAIAHPHGSREGEGPDVISCLQGGQHGLEDALRQRLCAIHCDLESLMGNGGIAEAFRQRRRIVIDIEPRQGR